MSAHPFVDPVRGREVTLHIGDTPGVEHPDCDVRADVSPQLDCFYCPACGWNGRISGAWFIDLVNGVTSAPPVWSAPLELDFTPEGVAWFDAAVDAPTTPLAELPLYCVDCNEVHVLSFLQIEKIVYALQGEHVDLIGGLRTEARSLDNERDDDTPDCLLATLAAAEEPEALLEWTEGLIESREAMQPLDCPGHDDETGPHHNPMCHYWDDER